MSNISLTQSVIAALVKRYTNKVLQPQANTRVPFRSEGFLKTHKGKHEQGKVIIDTDEMESMGMVNDNGTLPDGGETSPKAGNYNPAFFLNVINIPRGAAKVIASKADGINLVMRQMKASGKGLGRQLGRAIFATNLGSPTTTVTANSSSTFDIADPSGIRVGMAIEVYSGSTFIERIRVTKVAIPVDPNDDATVSFTGGGTGSTAANSWTTSYTLHIRGSFDSEWVPLTDVHADEDLYSISKDTAEWQGNLQTSVGELTINGMKAFSTLIKTRSGEGWDCLVANSVNCQRYTEMLDSNVRFTQGSAKRDAQGMHYEFQGKPICEDNNCRRGDLFFHNQDDVLLHQYWDFEPEVADGGQVLVSRTRYAYEVQVDGAFNIRCERRNSSGRMSGITS